MQTIRQVRIHRFGGPEVLSFEEVPMPVPADDEVVIKVEAASVNPIDFKLRCGRYAAADESMLPLAMGRDVSGTVKTVGSAVRSLKVGDAVYAMLGMDRGGYAEYVTVKATEGAVKPVSLDQVHAAAVPLAALTAWQGLFDQGGLGGGQRVLIHGAGGGVGHFAVQFAKNAGAKVVATAASQDLDFLRALGADEVIDYRAAQFDALLRDLDLVFDLVGGDTQDRSFAVLRPGGMLVSTLGEPSRDKAHKHGVRVAGFMARPNAAQLAEIARLIDANRVRVQVQETFPLPAAAEAQQFLEREHVQGKLVLRAA